MRHQILRMKSLFYFIIVNHLYRVSCVTWRVTLSGLGATFCASDVDQEVHFHTSVRQTNVDELLEICHK